MVILKCNKLVENKILDNICIVNVIFDFLGLVINIYRLLKVF